MSEHTAENDALTDDERETLLHAFGVQFRTPGDHERFDLAIREVERMVAARVIRTPTDARPVADDVETLAAAIRRVTDLWDEPLDEVHDVPQIVNAVLASDWFRDRIAAEYERGLLKGYEDGLLSPQSEWMRARKEELAQARADERERIARAIEAQKRGEQTGPGFISFGGTEPRWLGDQFYERAARIAREGGQP